MASSEAEGLDSFDDGADPEEGDEQQAMKWRDFNLELEERKRKGCKVGCLSLRKRLKLLGVEDCGNNWNEEGRVLRSTEFML